jgi:S-formylglutathione hydrolase
MYTYISEELPRIVEAYFPVQKGVRSIIGHSMGGNGSLLIAARNPDLYRSVSAFAPLCNPTSKDSILATEALSRYFANNIEAAENFDCSIAIRKASKMPNGLVDFGTHDEYMKVLQPQALIDALGESGHKNIKFRWQEGYDHGQYFYSTFIEDHIAFHAQHLKK